MGRRKIGVIPKVSIHRQRNKARVRIGRREIWLGPAGSKVADAGYRAVMAAWGANGGTLPDDFQWPPVSDARPDTVPIIKPAPRLAGPTVADLLAATLSDVGGGKTYAELKRVSRWWRLRAVADVLEPYASTPAIEFGPRLLGDVARALAAGSGRVRRDGSTVPRTRTWCLEIIGEIRRLFRDAVAREQIPPERLVALESLRNPPIDAAADPIERHAVPDAVIEATTARLPAVVADLVWFIRYTGCRPGEAMAAAPCEIDTTQTPWVWQPRNHKTKRRGGKRVIAIGPRGRAILGRWMLGRPADAVIFSRHELGRASDTPTVKIRQCRNDGAAFTSDDLRQRVVRAAIAAGVEAWTPYRLRHSGLSAIREHGTRDAAQSQAGHTDPRVTDRYAKPSVAQTADVVERIG